MMSVSKKREMFESGAHVTPEADKPDPAMMPLSQRKALFEKNKSVPTPIARFGESVTPAMLETARAHQMVTPKVAQPSAPAPPAAKEDLTTTPQLGRKTGDMHKKLFEANNADWRDNSIAKKAAAEKQNEMNLLLNRYNHLRKHSEDPKQAAETPNEEPYYPGVNSMKRVKVSPPKPGQLYPNLESDTDRPS